MISIDLFTKARLKIAFLYLILGVVITGTAGFFIYSDLTAIVSNLLGTMTELLTAGITVNQSTAASVIAENIYAQVRHMDLAIGIWLVVVMVFSAYLLAGITMRPVKRAMDRQKRFMANISHELRTPLSVMKTNTEATLLGGEALTRAELIEAVTGNLEELDRMSKIIDFLLKFSDTENALTRLNFPTVDIVESSKKALALIKRSAEDKKIKLSLTAPITATVSGDATALEGMILNLLKNAVAYTPKDGSVNIDVVKKFGVVTVSVRDTGVGIPAKDIENVFEAFRRGDNTGGKKKDGHLGLGLAIVKEIATLHGATVSVKSEVDKGTTFTIRFPRRLSRWLALPY